MPSNWTPRSGRGSVRIPLDDPKPFSYPRRGAGPTAAERAEAAAQNKRLKDIKVTPKEGKIIDSANRSEGGGQAKGGKVMKKMAAGGVAKVMPTAKQMGDLNMKKGGKVKKMAFGGMAAPAVPGGSGGIGGTMNPNARRISNAGVSMQDQAANQAQMAQTIQSLQGMGNPGMKKGGKVKPKVKSAAKPAGKSDKAGRAMVKKSADTMGRAMKFAKGGGIERKGKTNTKMVKMCGGGKMARGGKVKKGC